MTGRARGRARGRGRSAPQQEARRPGADEPGSTRGHSRGAAPPAQAQPPSQAPAPSQPAAPPTEAMAQLSVQGEGGQERRPRFSRYQEVECRPKTCTDKCGATGTPIRLVTNYFTLNMTPGKN